MRGIIEQLIEVDKRLSELDEPVKRPLPYLLLLLLFGCTNSIQAQEPDVDAHCEGIEDSLQWLLCSAEAELTATAEARPDVPTPTGVTARAGLDSPQTPNHPSPYILVEWDTPPDFVEEILVRAKYPPNAGHPIEGGSSEATSDLLRVKPSEFSYFKPCDVSDSHIRITNRCLGRDLLNRFSLKAGRIYGVTVTFATKDKGRVSAEVVWARIPLDAPSPTPWPTTTPTPLPAWVHWTPTPTPIPVWITPTPPPAYTDPRDARIRELEYRVTGLEQELRDLKLRVSRFDGLNH